MLIVLGFLWIYSKYLKNAIHNAVTWIHLFYDEYVFFFLFFFLNLKLLDIFGVPCVRIQLFWYHNEDKSLIKRMKFLKTTFF